MTLIGRVIGTAFGAFIGFLFVYFNLTEPPFIGLAIVLVILFCGMLKINHSILITVTLCLLIMFNPDREGGLLRYTFFRTVDTALGVLIGVLINWFVAPPKHLENLVKELENLLQLVKSIDKGAKALPSLQS
jgi:uncharacterized membrane protein YgaE (UPF0421/DUF939 family)